MLVYVAIMVLGYLVYGPWKDPLGYNFPQTKTFEAATQIPRLFKGSRVNLGALMALAGVLALYAVLEAMTVVAHTRFSIPYNVKPWLAAEPSLPVMVYRLDPPVTYELGLYRQTAPVVRVNAVNELPATGDYYLIAKTSDVKDFQDLDVLAKPLIEAQWVDHKTGTLPRQIALAAGRAPLERFSVFRVTPR
jgi:hypothetical protein